VIDRIEEGVGFSTMCAMEILIHFTTNCKTGFEVDNGLAWLNITMIWWRTKDEIKGIVLRLCEKG
jgi:hypothetical protein